MKRITIFQEGSSPIAIDDSDEKKIEQYTKELSKLLESSHVAILHTSSSSIIIRPNKISSIVVSDIMGAATPSKQESKENQKQPEKEEKNEEVIENSITD